MAVSRLSGCPEMHKLRNDSTFQKEKLPNAMDHFQEPGHDCRLMRPQLSARSLRALTLTWGWGGGGGLEGPCLKSLDLILQMKPFRHHLA